MAKKLTYAEKKFPKGTVLWFEGHKATVLTHSWSDPYTIGIGWMNGNEPITETILVDGTLVIYPTEEKAKEFYRNLCSTVNGNAEKTCQGIMSVDMICDAMEMPYIEQVEAFMNACREYGITERQGGAWVV